jgi:hypothetical protein
MGKWELRITLRIVFKLCGQEPGSPIGFDAQLYCLVSRPNSPPFSRKGYFISGGATFINQFKHFNYLIKTPADLFMYNAQYFFFQSNTILL